MRRHAYIRAAIAIILAVALMVGIVFFATHNDKWNTNETTEMSENFGQLKVVTLDGVQYREKPAVTTLLLAGIDKGEDYEPTDEFNIYRDGGQADFLMLIAFDHTDKKIHQLQFDRDTMVDIDILGIFGNEVGTRKEQLCLSHSFGKTKKDNALYTVKAVKRLLDGLDIDSYYMIDYSAMGTINDALGGVEVNIEYDMTSLHPEWTVGSRVTLQGKEAEEFVRARMTIGEGTNEERMSRQNEFMKNAVNKMKENIRENTSFAEELLSSLRPVSATNMSDKSIAEEVLKSRDYELLAIDHPAGTYTMGDDGFVEFHMEDNAAVQWVLEHLYTRVE